MNKLSTRHPEPLKYTQQGYILPTVVVFSITLMGIGLLLLQMLASLTSSVQSSIDQTSKDNVKHAGIASAVHCINTTGQINPANLRPNINCNSSANTGTYGILNDDNLESYNVTTSSAVNRIALASRIDSHSNFNQKLDIPIIDLRIDQSPTELMEVSSSQGVLSEISSGNQHTCAIADSKAYCWGYNGNYQVGASGSTYLRYLKPTEVDTSGALGGKVVTQVSAGANHTCAIADDNAYCWGGNMDYQLGTVSTSNASTPRAVRTSGALGGKKISQIAAGQSHTCVIADGEIYCWGLRSRVDEWGNYDLSYYYQPTNIDDWGVLNGGTATQISTAPTGSHTCAIVSSDAYCWGENWNGVLGDGSTQDSTSPIAVDTYSGLSGRSITQISAGGSHTCAIADDEDLYCWGSNSYGQFGNNTTTSSRSPTEIDLSTAIGDETIIQLTTGSYNTCVLTNLALYCWGRNSNGQLGNNTTTNSLAPVSIDTSGVTADQTILQADLGNGHTCVVTRKNSSCWGKNWGGQLGDSTQTNQLTPALVDNSDIYSSSPTASYNITSGEVIATHYNHTCWVSNGKGYCAGGNSNGELGNGTTTYSKLITPVFNGGVLFNKTVTQISVGSDHTCAIADKSAYCWGGNLSGQLGDTTNINRLLPVKVALEGDVTSITAEDHYTCAIADGKPYCWGSNDSNQLGISALGEAGIATPTPVAANINFYSKKSSFITAKRRTTCAIAEGDAYCWGYNSSPIPTIIERSGALSTSVITDISNGWGHICILADEKGYCWGSNARGEIGIGSTGGTISSPTAINGDGYINSMPISDIDTGAAFTCAIAGGEPYCWGANLAGELGIGQVYGNHPTPRLVNNGDRPENINTVRSLSLGPFHNCVSGGDSRSYCTGNAYSYSFGKDDGLPHGWIPGDTYTPVTPEKIYDTSNITSY